MTADEIEHLFTGPDGRFSCARWGRPVAPVIFGLDRDDPPAIGRLFFMHPLVRADPDPTGREPWQVIGPDGPERVPILMKHEVWMKLWP